MEAVIFDLINSTKKEILFLRLDKTTVYKTKGKLGYPSKIEELNFSSNKDALIFSKKIFDNAINSDYEKLEESKFVSKMFINFLTETLEEEDNWNLIFERDKIEDELEDELFEYSRGNYVGSSGMTIVYDIWNLDDNIKKVTELITKILERRNVSKFKISVINN